MGSGSFMGITSIFFFGGKGLKTPIPYLAVSLVMMQLFQIVFRRIQTFSLLQADEQ